METNFEFGRLPSKRGQMPMATSRLVQQWLGKNKEASCHH